MLARECKKELTEHIIPFWDKLVDEENGGFYGYVGHDLAVDKNADKGVILHSRILWFYSNCFIVLKNPEYLKKAKHAYDFLVKNCVDRQNGGVYWMVTADGKVSDGMKHTYCQAFFIYALSSYYDASKDEDALILAKQVYDTVEQKCRDEVAYQEAFTSDWQLMENDALSENGLMADKTMNTTLHLIEAYTELYRVSNDKNVLRSLYFLMDIMQNKIYDEKGGKLMVFFDKQLNEIGDIYSYGHDIEATWLMDRACDVIGDEHLTKRVRAMNKVIVANIASRAFINGRLNNEVEKGVVNTLHIWWVQAEGVVGFYNAYQRYGDAEYLDIARSLWEYIKAHIIDKREGGEWYSQLFDNEQPDTSKPTVDPWKCPYHNGRMCLEIISRA